MVVNGGQKIIVIFRKMIDEGYKQKQKNVRQG